MIYLGSSVKVCFVETILRDQVNGRLGAYPIPEHELHDFRCATIALAEPLRLVNLRGDHALRMGIPTDAIRASTHELGKLWSRAIWAHGAQPDGILYSSRLNEEPNIALYDRALGKLKVTRDDKLMAYGPELVEIIKTFDLAVI